MNTIKHSRIMEILNSRCGISVYVTKHGHGHPLMVSLKLKRFL